MEIKDLQPKQGNVEVTVEVTDKGEIREFQKFGNTGRVCNATVKDASGSIALTLWNDDIDKVNVGDRIHIENGFVNEWQGEKQLTTGRFGKLEILGNEDENESHETVPEEQSTSEDAENSEETDKPAEEVPKEAVAEPEHSDQIDEEFVK